MTTDLKEPLQFDWAAASRRCRAILGLKQTAFAEYLGVNQGSVSRWENGSVVPSVEVQKRLRDLMQAPLLDRLMMTQIRMSQSKRIVTYASGEALVLSAGIVAEHKKPYAEMMAYRQTPLFRRVYGEHRDLLSWRTPAYGRDVAFIRAKTETIELNSTTHALVRGWGLHEITPHRLETGEAILISTKTSLTQEEYDALPDRPEVITLDEVIR